MRLYDPNKLRVAFLVPLLIILIFGGALVLGPPVVSYVQTHQVVGR